METCLEKAGNGEEGRLRIAVPFPFLHIMTCVPLHCLLSLSESPNCNRRTRQKFSLTSLAFRRTFPLLRGNLAHLLNHSSLPEEKLRGRRGYWSVGLDNYLLPPPLLQPDILALNHFSRIFGHCNNPALLVSHFQSSISAMNRRRCHAHKPDRKAVLGCCNVR